MSPADDTIAPAARADITARIARAKDFRDRPAPCVRCDEHDAVSLGLCAPCLGVGVAPPSRVPKEAPVTRREVAMGDRETRDIIRAAEAAVMAGAKAERERRVHRWECGRCHIAQETPKAPEAAPDGCVYCPRCASWIGAFSNPRGSPRAAHVSRLIAMREREERERDDDGAKGRPLPKADEVPEAFRFEQRRAAEAEAERVAARVQPDTPEPPKDARLDTEAAACDEGPEVPPSATTGPTRSPSTTSPSTTATASRSSPGSRRKPGPGGSSMQPPAPSSTLSPTPSTTPSGAPSSAQDATPGGASTQSGEAGTGTGGAAADACPKACGKTAADFATTKAFKAHVFICGRSKKGVNPFTPEMQAKSLEIRRANKAKREAEKEAAKPAAKGAPPTPAPSGTITSGLTQEIRIDPPTGATFVVDMKRGPIARFAGVEVELASVEEAVAFVRAMQAQAQQGAKG